MGVIIQINQEGGGGTPAELAVSITYAELKALCNGGNLVPGTWYRITDYACTTTQGNTQSANHAFDILVRADDESQLNENAYAAHHDGDTYFANSKLEAWQLKYCLDNDTSRFGWADGANGKGVVYYMKDEWGNECPYDFKNVLFSRTTLDGVYFDQGSATNVYTFNAHVGSGKDSMEVDATVLEASNNYYKCTDNVVKEWRDTGTDERIAKLNDNVFLMVTANIVVSCSFNTLEFGCHNNTFGNNCYYNTFGNDCNNNTFGNGCFENTFGNNCNNNTFGNNCFGNTFGNNCYSNSFGNYFQYNTFGNGCNNNTFGNNCHHSTFGNNCFGNTFGNNCRYNTFGNYCYYNTFGNYCYYNTIFDGVEMCSVTGGSDGSPIQYCQILNGNYADGKTPKAIPFTANLNQTQVAGLDANGNVVVYIPVSLVPSNP